MKKIFNFMKYRVLSLIISLVVILIGMWFFIGPKQIKIGPLTPKGLNLGIDFQGGLLHQVTIYSGIPQDVLRKYAVEVGLGNEIQEVKVPENKRIGNETSYLVKTLISKEQQEQMNKDHITAAKLLDPQIKKLYKMINEYNKLPDGKYILNGKDLEKVKIQKRNLTGVISKSSDNIILYNATTESNSLISPGYSKSLRLQAVLLVFFVIFIMLLYITFRFKFKYGVGAVFALVHDVLVIMGFIAVTGLEFNYTIVAAVLFIIGYSLNDTIVIFDRIRENNGILKDYSTKRIINISVSQSLSRTIITSLTTLLAVIALYIWGGKKIQDFALSLIVGIISGTYSSIFIASPVVDAWDYLFMNKKKRKRIKEKEIKEKPISNEVIENKENISDEKNNIKKESIVISKKQKMKLLSNKSNKKKKK